MSTAKDAFHRVPNHNRKTTTMKTGTQKTRGPSVKLREIRVSASPARNPKPASSRLTARAYPTTQQSSNPAASLPLSPPIHQSNNPLIQQPGDPPPTIHSPLSSIHSPLARITDWPERAHVAKYSVRALAKACGVSVRTLERFFLPAFSEPPRGWLKRLRMQRAVDLLRDGSTVKETAGCLGYKYPTHFSAEFKRAQGVPPRDHGRITTRRGQTASGCRLSI
jgi:AraC-like DNA-binding protein